MSYLVQEIGTNETQVLLIDEPDYYCSLRQNPPEMEPFLKDGSWLVLEFVPWSVPDRISVSAALAAVKELRGHVKLGLRIFDTHEHIRQWCPQVTIEYASPVWISLHEGKFVGEATGQKSKQQILEVLEKDFSNILDHLA